MALPDSNISVAMVKAEIYAATNDVGQLCRHPNIKKWSKWKPVKHNSLTPITQNQLALINFGLEPPTPSSDYTTVVNTEWEYSKPTGGLLSPYRLTDFRNYYHNAGAIVGVMSDIDLYKSGISSREIQLLMNISDSDFQIGLNDFINDVGSYYYGVVFESGLNYQYKHIKTAKLNIGYDTINNTPPIGSSRSSFEISMNEPPFSSPQSQPIKLYHVLVNQAVPTMQSLGNVTRSFLSLPSDSNNVSYITIKEAGIAGGLQMKAVSVGVSPVGVGYPIGDYMNIDGDGFYTRGALYIGFDLRNTDDVNTASFEGGSYEMLVSRTYFGDNTTRIGVEAYNEQGEIAGRILVPPNSTRFVWIGGANVANTHNGQVTQVTEPTKVFTDITVYKNSARVGSAALMIKSNINI